MNHDPSDSAEGPAGEATEGEEAFADVTAPLGRLADALDRQHYPGDAWSAVRVSPRPPRVLHILAATATAAAVLLGAATAYLLLTRGEGGPARPAAPTLAKPQSPAPPGKKDAAATTARATRIDPSIASQVTWSMPSFSMPKTTDANGFGWSVPRFSFPSFGHVSGRSTAKPRATSRPDAT